MKKLTLYVVLAFLSFTFVPTPLHAGTETVTETSGVKEVEATKAKALLTRLDEINKMDKSALNAGEKKGLRKEVRSIRNQLKEIQGGVYLSVGAIIIIILLLIIFL